MDRSQGEGKDGEESWEEVVKEGGEEEGQVWGEAAPGIDPEVGAGLGLPQDVARAATGRIQV